MIKDYKLSTLNLIPPTTPFLATGKKSLSSALVRSQVTSLYFLTVWMMAILSTCSLDTCIQSPHSLGTIHFLLNCLLFLATLWVFDATKNSWVSFYYFKTESRDQNITIYHGLFSKSSSSSLGGVFLYLSRSPPPTAPPHQHQCCPLSGRTYEIYITWRITLTHKRFIWQSDKMFYGFPIFSDYKEIWHCFTLNIKYIEDD